MANEQEPIKSERIDNPDGTYTVKEVYDKPNFDCYLSCIETFNKNEQMLSSKYYKDNKFKNVIGTESRINNADGSYVRKMIYSEPDNFGFLSAVEYYNEFNISIKGLGYKDNNFQELEEKILRKFIRGNKFSLRLYTHSKSGGYYSEIRKWDKDNNLWYKHQYKFKGLLAKIIFWLSW